MADTKISALTSATTPLAGTEVLPIVQSGVTKKVATDDLTVRNVRSNATTGLLQVAGPADASTRVMTVPDANFTAARIDAAQSFTGDQTLATGNLIIGTSGKGIDFSATPGTGTSELLNDYEEGTWTPDFKIGSVSATQTSSGIYTKVGRLVTVVAIIDNIDKGALTGNVTIAGFPFTSGTLSNVRHSGAVNQNRFGLPANGTNLVVTIGSNVAEAILYSNLSTNLNSAVVTDVQILSTTSDLYFTLTYST